MTRRFQTALARAYTDSTARQELYRGETGAFACFELSATELTSLAEFARENRVSLELYAAILVKKKGAPLQKSLPVMYEVLQFVERDGWNRMWSEFYEALPPSEGDTPASQTEAFAAHVASRSGSFGGHSQLVAEAARYERVKASLMGSTAEAKREPGGALRANPNTRTEPAEETRAGQGAATSRTEVGRGAATRACDADLKAGDGRTARRPFVPGPFVVESFQYDLLAIKNRTALAGGPPPITRTSILFCRHAENGDLIVARITSALAAVIAQCDGSAAIEEIAVRLELPITAVESAVSVLRARGVVAQPSEGVQEHV